MFLKDFLSNICALDQVYYFNDRILVQTFLKNRENSSTKY